MHILLGLSPPSFRLILTVTSSAFVSTSVQRLFPSLTVTSHPTAPLLPTPSLAPSLLLLFRPPRLLSSLGILTATTPLGTLWAALAHLARSSSPGPSLQIFKFLTIPTLLLSFTVPLARVPPQTSVWCLRLLPLDVTGPFFPILDQITSPSLLGFPSPLTMLPMSAPLLQL